MQAGNPEKKKRDLRISAAKNLEPEVINDKMIKEYVEAYNLENKIFDQENVPISKVNHLSLSFKSNYFLVMRRFDGN